MLQSLSPAGNFRFSFVAFEGTACPCCAFGFESGWGVLEGLFSWGHNDKHIHNSVIASGWHRRTKNTVKTTYSSWKRYQNITIVFLPK